MKKSIFLVALLCCGCFLCCRKKGLSEAYLGKRAVEVLRAMPKSDRRALECFFRGFIEWNGGAYVLHGKKPMAFDVLPQSVHPCRSFADFTSFITPRRIKYIQGYRTWRRYEKFFPMVKYAFFYEPFVEGDPLVTLVNKAEFGRQVAQYDEDFERVLGGKVTADLLLEEGRVRPFVCGVLRGHDLLLGILLGYGRDNGYFCHQMNQLASEEEQAAFCEAHQFHSAWTDEEFQEFCKQFESVSWISAYITGKHMEDLNFTPLPGFAAVANSTETLYWREHYLDTRQAIVDFYEGKDFLEATLTALTASEDVAEGDESSGERRGVAPRNG